VYQLENEMPHEELYEWASLLAEEAREAKEREAQSKMPAMPRGRRR
jgi:hypothetical protein